MIVYQLGCLFITYVVLQTYIVKGVHSRTHRLLPLVMGLIGLYNFYKVFEWLTYEHYLFGRLADMLTLQMLYLVIHYVVDFMYMKLSWIVELLLFVNLTFKNIVIIQLFNGDEIFYEKFFSLSIADYIFIIIVLGTYALLKKSYSKRVTQTNRWLYFAILVPNVIIFFQNSLNGISDYLVPGALEFSMLIFLKLILNGNILDTSFLLQEKIYDTSDIGIVLFDEDFYYIDANMTVCESFQDEINSLKADRSTFPYKEALKQIADNPQEYKEICINGKYYNCLADSVYRDGHIRGYILYLIDISRHKDEIHEIEMLKKQAEELTLSKSRFLARISHDFRSPLHAIIGVADILASKDGMSEINKGLIMHTKAAANSLLQLVNSVLTFSKLESTKLELENKEYDFVLMLEELTQMCIANIQSKNIDFAINIKTKCPRILVGDLPRVREMIQNILSNAIKFTQEGEIVCDIRCTIDNDNNKVLIKCVITDTGEGISEDKKEKMFEEYISSSDNNVLNGAGLGLAIVRQLCELMHGYVSARRREVVGSEFTLVFEQQLPDTDSNMEIIEPLCINQKYLFSKTKNSLVTSQSDYVYKGARVLVADDMHINRIILKEMLSAMGIETDTVNDGLQALEAAKKKDYDMILLDQMMPVMTGDEAAVQLKKFYSNPVVLVTANVNAEFETIDSDTGFTDFLPKPVDNASLQNIVDKYLSQKYKSSTYNAIMTHRYGSSVYRVTLEAFVREIEPMIDKMSQMADSDIALLGTKVHGIKGVARQLDKTALSEAAEIMEMAAKTGNKRFIDSHMEDFLTKLKAEIEDTKEELEYISMYEDNSLTNKKKIPKIFDIDKNELYNKLLKAFEECDIDTIEKELELLEGCGQIDSDEERKALEMLKQSAQEYEYDEGIEVLKDIMKKG